MSQGLVISLIIIGVLLIAIEVFLIPGTGISGILGMTALIIGIFLVADSMLEGLLITAIVLIVLGIIIYWSFRLPRTKRLWRKFSLSTRQISKDGYVAPKPQYESYLGQVGVALTQLRPAGTANFDGVHLDVVTEGGYINSGADIKVISVEGTRIIVRAEGQSKITLNK